MGAEGTFVYGGRRGDCRGQFVNGETVLWINSSAYFGGFKMGITGFEFGHAMLPLDTAVADAPQNSIIGGATLWVLTGHEQPEYTCVADFFQFVSAAEQQAYWHQNTGYVPITSAAYELAKEQGYYDETPQAEVGILQLSLPSGEFSKGYRMGFYVQIRDVMNREFGRIFAGETDVDSAFDGIETEGNKLLARFAKTSN